MSKSKYIWEKKTDTELQLWPDGSSERYLTDPFVPAEKINKVGGRELISYPSNMARDFLRCRGVLSAGITRHKKGFYQQRAGAEFHVLVFGTGGMATLSIGRDKFSLKRGDVLVCPSHAAYGFSCDSQNWDTFWFHLENSARWEIAPDFPVIRKSKSFDKLENVVNAFADELYGKKLSPVILESYASLITEFIKREISNNGSSKEIDAVEDVVFARAEFVRFKNVETYAYVIVAVYSHQAGVFGGGLLHFLLVFNKEQVVGEEGVALEARVLFGAVFKRERSLF